MASRYIGSILSALLAVSSLTPVLASPSVELVSSLEKRDGIIPAVLPGSWTSLGCYNEIGRTLTGGGFENTTTMTTETCIAYCENRGFRYAGTEYGVQCWCGNTITPPSAPSTGCSMTCGGNSTEACGGPDRLNLFFSGQSGPQVNPGPGLWASLGCYTEGQTGRILLNGVATVGGAESLTIAKCTDACRAAGYSLAGAEYGQECWCGNTISNGGTLAPEGASGCNVLCKGNASEYCGGPSRLNLYNFNGTYTPPTPATTTTSTPPPTAVPTVGAYVYYGCQTEGFNVRALGAKGTTSPTMTTQSCESFCLGYNYFGTEYGSECYCGNSFGNGSTSVPDTECNVLCSGNVNQFCGAGNRLSVYLRNGTVTPPTPTDPGATLPAGWSAQGCWVDGANGRVLSVQRPDSATQTIENCVNSCASSGFKIAGLEYSQQCFCDNVIRNGGDLAIAQTDCNMPCGGNSAQICGAGNRLSLFSVGTPVKAPTA